MTETVVGEALASVEQEQLWLLNRLNPGTTIYNEDFALRLTGELSVPAFKRALAETVAAHPVLHSRFRMGGDVLMAEPDRATLLDLRVIDLSALPGEQREDDLLQWAGELAEEPFSLTEGRLVRYGLAKLGPREHAFVMVHHHVVTDLASFVTLVGEIGTRYAAMGNGHRPGPEAGPDYREFALKQREEVAGGPLDLRLRAWAGELAGAPDYVEVPTDLPRPPVKSTSGGVVSLPVPEHVQPGLRRLAAAGRVTPVQALLSAYVVLMRHHTGHDDLVLGVGDDGRPPEFAGTVGMFARLMPLRFRLSATTALADLLAQVRDTTLQAAERKMVPLSRLLNMSARTRDPARTPLVQLTFNIAPILLDPDVLPGMRASWFQVPRTRCRFDLSFNLVWGQTPAITVEYDAELYRPETVESLARQYLSVIEQMIAAPGGRVGEIELPAPGSSPEPLPYAPEPVTGTSDAALEWVVAECFEQVLGVGDLDPEDDFFALGGHSMAAAELVDLVAQELGVDVRLLTVFEHPTIQGFAAALRAQHPDLPEALARLAELGELDQAERELEEEELPEAGITGLTPSEESFWVVEQIMPGTSINVPTIALRLAGPLDLSALQEALDEVVARQEALRTRFAMDRDTFSPRRVIEPSARVPIEVVDLSQVAPEEQAGAIAGAETRAAGGFDVSVAPLMRLTVVVLGEDDHELLLSFHHMVVDKWSMAQVFFPDLERAYRERLHGTGSDLAEPQSFSRLAAQQESWRSSAEARRQAAYWRGKLAGLRPLDPPTDHTRPDQATFEGEEFTRELDAAFTGRVRELARSHRVSRFMLFTAALTALLRGWTGTADVHILTPSDNRAGRRSADVLGCFINMLVLRLDRGAETWGDLLVETREVVTGAYAHQRLPFADVLREASQDGPALRGWGSYVGLNYLQGEHHLDLEGCRVAESRLVGNGIYACDLELFVTELGDRLRIDFRYRTALWTRRTMENLADDLIDLLDQLTAKPSRPVGRPRRLLGASLVPPNET